MPMHNRHFMRLQVRNNGKVHRKNERICRIFTIICLGLLPINVLDSVTINTSQVFSIETAGEEMSALPATQNNYSMFLHYYSSISLNVPLERLLLLA